MASRHLAINLARYVPRFIRPTGSKAERARPFAAAVNNGLVSRVAEAPWWGRLESELASFSEDAALMKGRHDDQVDACAMAFNALARRRAAVAGPSGAA